MANISAAAPVAPGEFRVGHVFSESTAVLSRHFLMFFVVALVAALPRALLEAAGDDIGALAAGRILIGLFLAIILGTLAQAVLVYGAFQDMRGRPVNLADCLKVGLGRFFPIIGLAICMSIGIMIGFLLLVVPGIILAVMWFVATPACVVEQLGPMSAMGRSSELTKGHRWKIFGMLLLVVVGAGIVTVIIGALLGLTGSPVLVVLGTLAWNGVWGAFYAIFGVVTYHDLRVAKEGVDVHQIAAVFD
jgi:Membrane domain of glycerophosphoryl diester phosphodiesterase